MQQHLDVVHELRELRRDVGRVADAQTSDRLLLAGLEKRFTAVERKLDGLSLNLVRLLKHMGVAGV